MRPRRFVRNTEIVLQDVGRKPTIIKTSTSLYRKSEGFEIMKLLTYKFEEQTPKWSVSRFELDSINLLAGLSGVGKTRILNTIFNLSQMIQKKYPHGLGLGKWNIDFEIDDEKYHYVLHIEKDEKLKKTIVTKETLQKNGKPLIKRTRYSFSFNNKKLPKLSNEDIGIYLLREEPKISRIYEEFRKIYIRRMNPKFQGGQTQSGRGDLGGISKDILFEEKSKLTLKFIHENFDALNVQLFLLKKYHPNVFSKIEKDFTEIFPFVSQLDVKPINEVRAINMSSFPMDVLIPILVVKEKAIKEEIPMMNLSSGMLRAIIQLVDVYIMPKNSIYLIDEFENSMGVRSLPVMCDLLKDKSSEIQFIFTTHHPYILNNVDVKYWKILTRKGSNVTVINGATFSKKFSKSHQDVFTQLMNSQLIEDGI